MHENVLRSQMSDPNVFIDHGRAEAAGEEVSRNGDLPVNTGGCVDEM
jgi:hypothetical protein